MRPPDSKKPRGQTGAFAKTFKRGHAEVTKALPNKQASLAKLKAQAEWRSIWKPTPTGGAA